MHYSVFFATYMINSTERLPQSSGSAGFYLHPKSKAQNKHPLNTTGPIN